MVRYARLIGNAYLFHIIKSTLNVAALYFEDQSLVFDKRWKGWEQYLHLLKTENCRL